MLSKTKIINHFDIASSSYDMVASVQKESANFLIEKLIEFDGNFYPETILDLGTGTGHVPEILLKHYKESIYVLNDISPGMIDRVRTKFYGFDNFIFNLGDMEFLRFRFHQLIISNFALQWVDDLFRTVKILSNKSRVMAFSCLIDGTFVEWRNILKNHGILEAMQQYPTAKELVEFCSKLNSCKLYYELKQFRLDFSNMLCFIKYLKKLGANMGHVKVPLNILRNILVDNSDAFTVTYNVCFVILGNKQ